MISTMDWNKKKSVLLTLLSIILALGVWQIAALIIDSGVILASPLQVLVRVAELPFEDGFFAVIRFTFSRILLGFFAGLAVGLLLALLAFRFPAAEILLKPYTVTIKSVPVASFVILALMLFSSKTLSVFVSFLIVLPVVYTNLLAGFKSRDQKLIEAARVFGVPWRRRLLYIDIPAIKSHLISACSIGMGLAWKSGVAAEVIGIPSGSVGEKLYYSKVYFDMADLFAWTVIIVLLSIGLEKITVFLVKKALGGIEKL